MYALTDGQAFLFVLGSGGVVGAVVLAIFAGLYPEWGHRSVDRLAELVEDPEPPYVDAPGAQLLRGGRDDDGGAAA